MFLFVQPNAGNVTWIRSPPHRSCGGIGVIKSEGETDNETSLCSPLAADVDADDDDEDEDDIEDQSEGGSFSAKST